jgi:hypothetical protein
MGQGEILLIRKRTVEAVGFTVADLACIVAMTAWPMSYNQIETMLNRLLSAFWWPGLRF